MAAVLWRPQIMFAASPERDKIIRRLAHGGDDDYQLMALIHRLLHAPSYVPDLFPVSYTGATEFSDYSHCLNEQK